MQQTAFAAQRQSSAAAKGALHRTRINGLDLAPKAVGWMHLLGGGST
jgi:hypothetical protein